MSRNIERAREVFDIEIAAMQSVKDNLSASFDTLIDKSIEALKNGGKLVVTGVGKSGHIGRKIAATLSSVGSTAIFLHPVEALHGDLGVLSDKDLLIALSYSGETDELIGMIVPAKRLGITLAAITGSEDSRLAQLSDIVVTMPVREEACPFKLAPTSTTTALLALGDALAMVLLDRHGFTKEDYGRFHPGGAIGRSMTLTAKDIMRSGGNCALITPSSPIRDALCAMGKARCGAATVVDDKGKVVGVFTDGDFRRSAEKYDDVLKMTVGEVMTRDPIRVDKETLAAAVIKLVEQKRINSIIVVDKEDKAVGLIDVQDLPGLKLM